MLINNSYVARYQEKTPAAVYSAFGTIPAAMVNITGAAVKSIQCGIRKIDMAFWYIIGIWHIYTRRRAEK